MSETMMQPPKSVYIYGLKDPRDGMIHYVGKTEHRDVRFREHIANETINAARVAWIADVKAAGLAPEMVTLVKTDRAGWRDAERLWIAKGRESGWPLTNIRNGGDGGDGRDAETTGKLFDWFKPYLSPSLADTFDILPIAQKEHICWQAAMAMLPYQETASARARQGEQVDWGLWNDMQFWAACATTTELLRDYVTDARLP